MKAVPVTKVEELMERLKPFMDQLSQLDPFTLQRYKREARENMHAYPWAGFIALGMIAVLEWDESLIDEHYANALALQNDFETRSSYAISLHLIGKQEEAMHQAIKASTSSPENLSLLKNSGDYAQHAGRYSVAYDVLEKLKLRSSPAQQKSMGVVEMDDVISSVREVLNANGTSEDDVASCHKIAFRILRENRTPYTSTRIETDAQDKYVMYYIDVAADEEKVEYLDQLLGVALFDEVPDFNPDKYWVGFRKSLVQ